MSEKNIWTRSEDDLEKLRNNLEIDAHEKPIIVALDIGSSSTKFNTSIEQEREFQWINFETEIIPVNGREAHCITWEYLDLFIRALIIIIEECQLTPDDILALTGFTHSLVAIDKHGKAIALLDGPSYEIIYTEELGAKLRNFGFSEKIIKKLKTGCHCSLAKLLAVIENQNDFIKAFNLPEDFFSEGMHLTTIQGYLASRIFGLEFGLISKADWESFGNPTLEQMQEFLFKCGFPAHAILEVCANEFRPSREAPLVCTEIDLLAEVEVAVNFMRELGIKESTIDKILIAIATDSVGKLVIKDLIAEMKNLPEQGASYLTQRILGNGYRLVKKIIRNYLHTGEGDCDHYRMTDKIVSSQLIELNEEGLNNYRPKYYFFPKEDGTYLLLDNDDNSYDIDQLAEKVYQDAGGEIDEEAGEKAVEKLIFEIVAGIAFSLRQKILFVEETLLANQKLDEGQKSELQILLYGGMANHSFNSEQKSWGYGFIEILIAALPPKVKTSILHLDSAAQATLIKVAKKHGVKTNGELTMTQLDKKPGLLKTAYEAWNEELQRVIDDGKVVRMQSSGLMPANQSML